MKASDRIREALREHLGLNVTRFDRQYNTEAMRSNPFIVRWSAAVMGPMVRVSCFETMTECARLLRQGQRFAFDDLTYAEVVVVPPDEVDERGHWSSRAKYEAATRASDAMRRAAELRRAQQD
jgi:hypothetical protein